MIPQGCFESCAFRDNKFPLLANLFPALTSLRGWKVGKPWSQYGLSGSLGSCRLRFSVIAFEMPLPSLRSVSRPRRQRNGTDVRLLHWRIRTSKVETLFFQNASVRLHAVADGPKDGPVVVLLHGFPEFWYGWRRQIEPLAEAGFRVIVPDQRGYNLSSRPSGVAAYALTVLVSDVIAVADQLGQETIFLAAHRQARCPQRPSSFRDAQIPQHAPASTTPQLVHVFLSASLAPGSHLLRVQLPRWRAGAS